MRMFVALTFFIFSSFLRAQVMDSDTPDTQYLTDEEQKLSKEFVHEGLAEKTRQDECKGIEEYCNFSVCQTSAWEYSVAEWAGFLS